LLDVRTWGTPLESAIYDENADRILFSTFDPCYALLFRHTCATLMLENGADTRFIQQLLGHANLGTTQIYTNVSISQLQKVHEMTHPAKAKA